MIKRKLTTAEEDYIIIPDYSAIKDDSWSDDSNFVKIPKAAVQSAKGKVLVMLFSARFTLLRNQVTGPFLSEILFFVLLHYTTHRTTPHNTARHNHMLRHVNLTFSFLSCNMYILLYISLYHDTTLFTFKST